MGRFSVRTFVRTYVRPALWAIQPGLRPSQPGPRPSQPGLRPSQPSLRPRQPARHQASGLAVWSLGLAGWPRGGDGQTNGRTENLHILQDFVPYQCCCPVPPMKFREVEQGKGTANHLMPLGYLFSVDLCQVFSGHPLLPNSQMEVAVQGYDGVVNTTTAELIIDL